MIPQCARLAAGNDDWLWFDDPAIEELWPSTLETLSMVGLSSLIAVVFGALLGVVLKATRRDGLLPAPAVNAGLGFIVNIGRSIPFVIIMFLLIPFSRFVTGTGSGWLGATIPLGIAAIPYFARMVESNLDGVEQGKVEAAQMMGASRGKILTGVLVRESMPALIGDGRCHRRGRPRLHGPELRVQPERVVRPHHHRGRHRRHRPDRPTHRRHAQPAGRPPLRNCQSEPAHPFAKPIELRVRFLAPGDEGRIPRLPAAVRRLGPQHRLASRPSPSTQ